MVARQFQVIEHLPYSPDLAQVDFFLVPKVKRKLPGLTFPKETFKKERERAARTLKAANFATAFMRWYERCEKCVNITGSYVEIAKNKQVSTFCIYNCLFY